MQAEVWDIDPHFCVASSPIPGGGGGREIQPDVGALIPIPIPGFGDLSVCLEGFCNFLGGWLERKPSSSQSFSWGRQSWPFARMAAVGFNEVR